MPILEQQNGCILSLEHRPDGDLYVMSGGRTGRHAMSAEYTDEKRIKAHWEGYLAANPLIKYRVYYTREHQYREYNAKGEKAAVTRRTRKTVMACNLADAIDQARAYSKRFYPQWWFSLEGVETIG